jgi:hypothetical protein
VALGLGKIWELFHHGKKEMGEDGRLAQTRYTHISKCKNDKRREKRRKEWICETIGNLS